MKIIKNFISKEDQKEVLAYLEICKDFIHKSSDIKWKPTVGQGGIYCKLRSLPHNETIIKIRNKIINTYNLQYAPTPSAHFEDFINLVPPGGNIGSHQDIDPDFLHPNLDLSLFNPRSSKFIHSPENKEKLQEYINWVKSQNNGEGINITNHLRFNVLIQLPCKGGKNIYNDEILEVEERDLIEYRPDLNYHGCTENEGKKERVNLSFGFIKSGGIFKKYVE